MNKNINKIITTALVGTIGVNFTPVMASEKSDVISAKDGVSYNVQDKDSNDIDIEVINNAVKGSITIKYIDDATGNELIPSIVDDDLQLGDHTIQAELILDYEIIGDASKTITLTEANPHQVIEFRYTEAPDVRGSITVLYIDDKTNMEIGHQTVHSDLVLSEYTVTAQEREGYTIIGDYDKKVILTKDNPNQTVEFRFNKIESGNQNGGALNPGNNGSIVTPDANPGQGPGVNPDVKPNIKGSITIKYIDDATGNELIPSIVEDDLQLGDHTIQAELILDYELIGDDSRTITLTEANPHQVVEFRYAEAPEVRGSITVLYIDDKTNMEIGPQTVHSDLVLSEYTITAQERDGYTIIGDSNKKVTLTKDNPNQTVEFRFNKIESGNQNGGTSNPNNGGAIIKPEQKPETTPEVKPEQKPEVKPEQKPETKPEQKPETKPEQKPEEESTKPTLPFAGGNLGALYTLAIGNVLGGLFFLKKKKK